jgi:hypothetical protein
MTNENSKNNYISLKEATRYCNYSQDYLKLRARQNKLKAVKIGRNWVTTREWVEEYLNKIPNPKSQITNKFQFSKIIPKVILGLVVILIVIGVFINFNIFSEYFQWQTAHISEFLDEGLGIIPGRVVEIK